MVPLGGVEIGASCLYFQTQRQGWIVDSGVRFDDRDPLPYFAWLEEEQAPVDAIFVTHAHQDHTGSLPILARLYPDIPIYMTPATWDITRVMLHDAWRLAEQGVGTRLFTEHDLDSLATRIHPMGQDQAMAWQDIRVSTFSAGHILGAVSLGFETPEGSVLVSGDFSVRPGRILPGGARFARGTHFDTVVTEATYGNRLHPNRMQQEQGLVDQVSTVIASGGSVLIPAFAVGRAQEVLVILQEALRHNPQIPRFPLVVDGLVRTINTFYNRYPHLLNGPMRRLLHHQGTLFDPDMVRSVTSMKERRLVLDGPPVCIVTSSGMLSGGPSVYYASELAPSPAHAILLCGYQDEESPGRRLIHLAQTPVDERQWMLSDRVLKMRAQMGFYGLSAHADRQEIGTALSALHPKHVVVVHGEAAARTALAEFWAAQGSRVSRPEVGEPVTLWAAGDSAHPVLPAQEEAVNRSAWVGQVLLVRHRDQRLALVLAHAQSPGTVRVEDGGGKTWQIAPEQVVMAVGMVPAGQNPLRYLQQLWAAAGAAKESEIIFGRQPAQRIAYAVAEEAGDLLPSDTQIAQSLEPYGFRRLQADGKSKLLTAFCRFPWAVPDAPLARLREELAERGWNFSLSRDLYVPALQEILRGTCGPAVAMGPVHVYPQERRIVVPVRHKEADQPWHQWAQEIQERVGGRVTFQEESSRDPEASDGPVRWEQNAAAALLKDTADPQWRLTRFGLFPAEGRIVLFSTFPDPLKDKDEFHAWLRERSAQCGWRLELSEAVNQKELSRLAGQLLDYRQEPGLFHDQKIVKIVPSQPVSAEKLNRCDAHFYAQTGWHLTVDQGAGAFAEEASRPAGVTAPPGAWEVNRAMAHIREVAQITGLKVNKVSAVDGTLLLHCMTPESATPVRRVLDGLSHQTGWPIAVSPAVHQQQLALLAESLLGVDAQRLDPRIRLARQEVAVCTEDPLDTWTRERFYQMSGWQLIRQESGAGVSGEGAGEI